MKQLKIITNCVLSKGNNNGAEMEECCRAMTYVSVGWSARVSVEVPLVLRPVGHNGACHGKIRWESSPGRGQCLCKGPEVGMSHA